MGRHGTSCRWQVAAQEQGLRARWERAEGSGEFQDEALEGLVTAGNAVGGGGSNNSRRTTWLGARSSDGNGPGWNLDVPFPSCVALDT